VASVVAVALQWTALFVAPLVDPRAGPIGAMGALAAGIAILVWWIFFSRTRWFERVARLC
jgi:hypothetical protein